MTARCGAIMVIGAIGNLGGCVGERVHVMPELERIHRIAVVNLGDRSSQSSPEGELVTNEIVSLGFVVVERGHLQDLIREGFTKTGYVDERTMAQFGRGLGIDGVVLHQILSNVPCANKDGKSGDYDVIGSIRMVDVETGQIVLAYSPDKRASGSGNPTRAVKHYAERVVDDIAKAFLQKNIKIRPAAAEQSQGS